MDIDFVIQDTFAMIRPQWKLSSNLEEAGAGFADIVKQNYQSTQQEKTIESEQPDEEMSSEDDVDDEDLPVPNVDEAPSSGDDGENDLEAEVSLLPDKVRKRTEWRSLSPMVTQRRTPISRKISL